MYYSVIFGEAIVEILREIQVRGKIVYQQGIC